MKKLFPILYKKNNEGKIEQWKVLVRKVSGMKGYFVAVAFGELHGKGQTKFQRVTEGKNVGKKNETSVEEQAYLEAESKFNKKLKQGYVKSLKAAQAGKVDSIIKGGIVPMLALDFNDYKTKIPFPSYVQPKLDGERCVAIKMNGKVTLWTRTRKPILSCPHIIKQLTEVFKHKKKVVADGELYAHATREKFEELMKAVRKQKPSKESEQVQFHIYDIMVDDKNLPFKRRLLDLDGLPWFYESIEIVPTFLCNSHIAIQQHHATFLRNGYEGTMVRSAEGLYENKRSKHLLKYKEFKDAEFPIIGVIKGEDMTVIFICKNKVGKTFKVTMSGDKKKNQRYLKNHSLWQKKQLTVKYQSLTGKNGVPRFPVGLRIREKE